MAAKINEAHDHIAKAEKYLKTSFMKWKPDYDSAASEYSKAAVAFKNAKMLEEAKEAYLQEAEAHTNNKTLFHAAKRPFCYRALEAAGMMLKDMQRIPEAIQYIERASMMYVENGTPDTAALALDRAGKLIESQDLAKAVDLYQKAASVFENEDRLRQAVEMLGKASRLLVRQHKLDEAAVSIQKEKNMYKEIENYPTCFKKTIAQVLVHLHRNDFVAADKCVRESYSLPGFSGSEDCIALEQLLQGYDEQDEDQVHCVCNSPLFKYMDNDYAKLSISLRVPGGGKKKAPASAADAGEGGAGAGEADEDEYAGGLC
ncbi:gamma-soluble NSF attachment protein-like isoform X1 [Salvelinus fontinalis]|uniref:gamma-soluble NSF attachment protein-like isoform X1 n=1 Tax=Salmo trutta TaxID=8032 RepID=UPI000CDFF33F|nr:gamma-soluble NSF attachment protein isoform X1 [Salvelinus alpinus]XP_029611448.1 gamma-soluble NSF attachment protein-like isoform X1 [Salmo trutta]XP_055784672.1 gamma-soluble NSF attachment protein-like isoform X1 [Salvelinus fontinalis]